MKIFSPAAMAEIRKGSAIVAGAVEILCRDPIRLWGGYGVLPIEGEEYQPLGDRGLGQVSGQALGGAAQNIGLTLSGIEPEAIEVLDAEEVRRAPATLRRLIFSGDGKQMLDQHVFTRGRLDPLTVRDVIGGTATINTSIESAARGLGRRGGRMRTDADQRLIKANDGFFRNVSYAGEKNLYWGGQKPVTAAQATGAIPASGYAGGGFNQHIQAN